MNKRGVALILVYMVIAILAVLGSILVSRSVQESGLARREADSTRAFWIAEAGLNQGLQYLANNTSAVLPAGQVNFAGGTYQLTRVNQTSSALITATGRYGSSARNVTITVSWIGGGIGGVFNNTISVGKDMMLAGILAKVYVYNQTRINGTYSKPLGGSDWFQDKQEHAPLASTSIRIPDYNNNSVQDEFADFVAFGNLTANSYPASQVVHLQTNNKVLIWPTQNLTNKKVIFVEGSQPYKGNVEIWFDPSWQANQDMTIISTGNITYVQPLQNPVNSRLSTVSWGDYTEAAIFRSQHQSVIFTHANGTFIDVVEWGNSTGNVVVNGNMTLVEILTNETFLFSNRTRDGDPPPGFQFLGSPTTGGGAPTKSNWTETQ